MKFLSETIKSVLAGIAISVGGMVYLSCDVKYVGALLFSVGLITVCVFGLSLFTGRIGYVMENNRSFFGFTLWSVVGNLIGCLAAGLAKAPIGNVAAIVEAKLDKPLPAVFVDAVLCGLLVFISVDMFKKKNTYLGILVCIPTFILSGFEHSIADMFYLINARAFTAEAALFTLLVVLGNAVGGLLIPIGQKGMTLEQRKAD